MQHALSKPIQDGRRRKIIILKCSAACLGL